MTAKEIKAAAKKAAEPSLAEARKVLLLTFCIAIGFELLMSILHVKLPIALAYGGIVSLATSKFYMAIVRAGHAEFEEFKDMLLKRPANEMVEATLAFILIGIASGIGFVLLVIPGIILCLMYSQTFYILNDQPQLNAIDAMKASRKLMDGHKSELFSLLMSYLPEILMCILIIPAFYFVPEINTAEAIFYDQLTAHTTPDCVIPEQTIDVQDANGPAPVL